MGLLKMYQSALQRVVTAALSALASLLRSNSEFLKTRAVSVSAALLE